MNLSNMIRGYKDYRKDRISLISSENVTSNLVRLSLSLGLSDQYCSRLPSDADKVDNLTFSNIAPLDKINYKTRELVMDLFNAEECDVRALSGLSGMTVLLASLLKSGETLYKVEDNHGGHLSTAPLCKSMNINYYNMNLADNYRLDLDTIYKLNKEHKPKVVFLDSSYVLFPYPVKEIREIVGEDTIIIYDASHITALIGASLFQDPFKEGADIIHSTTHKALWGPQKAMILFKKKDESVDKVRNIIKDFVSNTHLHHILALYIALLEYKHFGKEYAINLQNNTKSFAESLYNYGLNISAKEYGFTQSNQLWINFGTKDEAIRQFKKLDKINVSANIIFLPKNQWGLRVAGNEITRYGAGKDEFDRLAKILSDLFLERKSIEKLHDESVDFKRSLGDIKYNFDKTPEGKKLIEYIKSTIN